MRLFTGIWLVVTLLAVVPAASAQGFDDDSPIRQGRYSFSGGGGLSQESFSLVAGVGYFVLDGLMPGVRYRYTRFNDGQIDYHASHHDLNVYARYYFNVAEGFYPFLVADVGYLKLLEWGTQVKNQMAEMFSVMGGAGLAYYLSAHFYVDVVGGMRHYIDPPNWSHLHADPNQFEWGIGFGAAF
jgi:opacity protein-like surface antigen